MTYDEAVDAVQVALRFQQGMTTRIQTELKKAQQHWEQSWPDPTNKPWFLITERASTSTVADEERLARPADWLADVEDGELWLTNADGDEVWIPRHDLSYLRQLYGNEDAAFPSYHSFDGLYYRLFPKPDAIYTAKLQYYQQDATLASGSGTNLWLTHAPYVLIGRAASLLTGAGQNSNFQLALAMQNDAIAAVNARSLDIKYNRQMAMGETI